MKCPHCDYFKTTVTDSRRILGAVMRRRECPKCGGARFTTFEVTLPELPADLRGKLLAALAEWRAPKIEKVRAATGRKAA